LKRPAGRPLGEYSQALLSAAAQGPATMVQLAHRAQVGYSVAMCKVPALARSGHLVALTEARPRVYTLAYELAPVDYEPAFVMLSRAFWELAPTPVQDAAG
jgi:hypothetical protein